MYKFTYNMRAVNKLTQFKVKFEKQSKNEIKICEIIQFFIWLIMCKKTTKQTKTTNESRQTRNLKNQINK